MHSDRIRLASGASPTVVVCGIAGVGKSSLISSALAQFPMATSWRASEIIGVARGIEDPEMLRALPANEILLNQELLVKGYRELRRTYPDVLVLLDAHSIVDSESGLIEIPSVVVGELGPVCIIHIYDNVDRILERRLADKGRTRPARSPEQLSEYQQRSIAACDRYSESLHVPVAHISSGDVEGFAKVIRECVRKHMTNAP